MISIITATQKFSALRPTIRVNTTELFVYRLRSYKDLETLIEKVSAVYDKKTLLQLYNIATSEPHSFLYVKLTEEEGRHVLHELRSQVGDRGWGRLISSFDGIKIVVRSNDWFTLVREP